MSQVAEATLEDLYRETGKAELIDGRIVRSMPVGFLPHRVAYRITRSLDDYAVQSGVGVGLGDNIGFTVPQLLSGRRSFSPDASYYTGALPRNLMRFLEGAPALAVEVRSEGDYDQRAEAAIAAKREDYFEAGTLVVWDVDPIKETIHVYRRSDPQHPTTYRRGQAAEAEPAVPGWSVDVDFVFVE